MKIKQSKIATTLRTASIIPFAMSLSFAAFATDASTAAVVKPATHMGSPKNTVAIKKETKVVKEAVDAYKATNKALQALNNNKPKLAIAALEVASGNLDALRALHPNSLLIPLDYQVQIFSVGADLKGIKKLESDIDDLISNKQYQTARPLIEDLVDEMRTSAVYLPIATYPAAIDEIGPLVQEGKYDVAKQKLTDVLDSYISEEEIMPLSIIRADEKIGKAMKVEQKAKVDNKLSDQDTKNKIGQLIQGAKQDIKIAEILGYGTNSNYQDLNNKLDSLEKAIGSNDFEQMWDSIKQGFSNFKNKITRPHHKK